MNGPVTIDVRAASKRFGALEVLRGVDLRVEPGRIVALLGSSGCGKTTLLRTIAGLERLDGGQVTVGERVLSAPGVHVPPERRCVGMVFQDWAAVGMVGPGGLGVRQPGTLWGGQQQRVALGRARAPRPGVLLLDEPFSN